MPGSKALKKLEEPLSFLRGAGPKRCALLAKLGLTTIAELLRFFPRKYEDRRRSCAIAMLVPGAPSVVRASVVSCESKETVGKRRLTTCLFTDGTGELEAVWFNLRGLEKTLTKGQSVLLYGIPSIRAGRFSMTVPEFSLSADSSSFTGIIPLYPLTEGITQKWLRSFIAGAVEKYSSCAEETLPQEIIEARQLMPIKEALQTMHRPASPEAWKAARRRFAYEEFFRLRLASALTRLEYTKGSAVIPREGPYYKKLLAALPFTFTETQQKAIEEIISEASAGPPMMRLLQGDVGSGKSAVALAFAAAVCDAGAQCALLAPTEILASQLHDEVVKKLVPAGIKAVFIKGAMTAAERKAAEAAAADGSAGIITGTHALLSERIVFKDLGALIIDEQQRFGVRQRKKLLLANEHPHLLMMSATPIPRTLALTLFGELELSCLTEKPAGRIPTETRIIQPSQVPELLRFILRETTNGGRVYWICPRVEEDEASQLPAAEKRFAWLNRKLPSIKTELVHGQLDSEAKQKAIEAFRRGESSILVGTTVLEVGVDVPEASVIVIEAPERYGLSQLHQLRGRVGRGTRRGLCVLISSTPEPEKRLQFFASTNDGFKIAEADLELRGSGELAGTIQHGTESFIMADPVRDAALAEAAAIDVNLCLKNHSLTELKKYAPEEKVHGA